MNYAYISQIISSPLATKIESRVRYILTRLLLRYIQLRVTRSHTSCHNNALTTFLITCENALLRARTEVKGALAIS